jgi:hypothetical protein
MLSAEIFFYYSDPVRLAPIQSDCVRLDHEPMGRFGAFGAAAPRGRIELLLHSGRLRHPSAGPPWLFLLQIFKERMT